MYSKKTSWGRINLLFNLAFPLWLHERMHSDELEWTTMMMVSEMMTWDIDGFPSLLHRRRRRRVRERIIKSTPDPEYLDESTVFWYASSWAAELTCICGRIRRIGEKVEPREVRLSSCTTSLLHHNGECPEIFQDIKIAPCTARLIITVSLLMVFNISITSFLHSAHNGSGFTLDPEWETRGRLV